METIYSKIIWDELGMREYKIHEEFGDKTDELIINWVRETPLEKVNEILFSELSWIDRIDDDGYYDGNFYGINQRVVDKMYKTDDGKPQSDVVIHDVGIFPSILHIAIKTGMHVSELKFMAKLLEVYYEKLPKIESVCAVK